MLASSRRTEPVITRSTPKIRRAMSALMTRWPLTSLTGTTDRDDSNRRISVSFAVMVSRRPAQRMSVSASVPGQLKGRTRR